MISFKACKISLLVYFLIFFTACSPNYKNKADEFERSINCGLTFGQVKKITRRLKASAFDGNGAYGLTFVEFGDVENFVIEFYGDADNNEIKLFSRMKYYYFLGFYAHEDYSAKGYKLILEC